MKFKTIAAFILGFCTLAILGAKIASETLILGNKTAEDITLTFDIGNGATNPVIKWDDTAQAFLFPLSQCVQPIE